MDVYAPISFDARRAPSQVEFGVAHVLWLEGRAACVHSQFGEDGYLAAIFEAIGTTNRWCLEVGAADGTWLSATKVYRDQGWDAVLIEADLDLFEKLEAGRQPWERVFHRRVDANSLAQILREVGAPNDMDLAVIDVDGQDYYLWRDTPLFHPRVLCIEYNPCTQPGFLPDLGGDGQAGRIALRMLGEKRGYRLVAETFCNLIFVREELVKGLGNRG